MGSNSEKLTKLHLKAFDLSDYTIKQLLKGVGSVATPNGLREYPASDVIASVETRLRNPKIQDENRAKLQRVLTWLNGESNVIPVDFLKGLPPERRIELLRARVKELEAKEQTLNEETSLLIAQARKLVANK
ncbi:hypothetical protein VB711_20350 [Cronbergia sp. UHCC 0137]|uniref:hypothetical protein n=1 Tax=Cronbergia sp. UHCC 0137 TaxID=3110239 RepID=UPI002B21C9B0|nr:hypothetical protein [Cronbergia sp. UHCC 0137]MEA5620178.1 hypothetical protein [Cronbergia sp. UHCC 0137]